MIIFISIYIYRIGQVNGRKEACRDIADLMVSADRGTIEDKVAGTLLSENIKLNPRFKNRLSVMREVSLIGTSPASR